MEGMKPVSFKKKDSSLNTLKLSLALKTASFSLPLSSLRSATASTRARATNVIWHGTCGLPFRGPEPAGHDCRALTA
jgi:hypothetical protein